MAFTGFLSASIQSSPLLTPLLLTAAVQAPSAFLSHAFPQTFPVECGDVISLLLAALLTALHFLQSLQTARHQLLLAFVTIWAARLGAFLGGRIWCGFRDRRLDKMRTARGAAMWMGAQTAWVWVTLLPVWVGLHGPGGPLRGPEVAGAVLSAAGLLVETVADGQKGVYLQERSGKGGGCDVGLFRWSRFANYFGEWLLWVGVAAIGWRSAEGWRKVLVGIGPWFVWKIFMELSIPLGIEAVKARSTEEEFRKWCQAPLFTPWDKGADKKESQKGEKEQ